MDSTSYGESLNYSIKHLIKSVDNGFLLINKDYKFIDLKWKIQS